MLNEVKNPSQIPVILNECEESPPLAQRHREKQKHSQQMKRIKQIKAEEDSQ